MPMSHLLQNIRAPRLHPWGVQVLGCALLLGAMACEVRAQSTTVSSPNAAFSRPEVTSLGAVVPTAPVRLRVWGFEVYDARLWTPVGFRHSAYTQFPFALELQYLRRLEGAAIASRSIDEMRRLGPFSDARPEQCQELRFMVSERIGLDWCCCWFYYGIARCDDFGLHSAPLA